MSNADKRTVSTDALETLGMVHFKPEARDAIHLAVLPATAGEDLKPGQHISYNVNGWAYASEGKKVGIVDPFLPASGLKRGDRFWLVVYPRMISSLRHVWEHPDFPTET